MTTAILSADQLRSTAPSIFAAHPWDRVSHNYRFVPTIDVLGMMEEQGFYPVKVSQSRTRIEGKAPFTKHMVRLRQAEHFRPAINDEIPEIVLVNSHDRSSAYQLYAGIFRLVCSNGMVVQSEDFGSFSLRHSGSRDLREQVIDTTCRIVEQVPKTMATIQEWKQIELPRPTQFALAHAAMELKPNPHITPAQLLTSRRAADDTNPDGSRDLWRTTNVLQESLMQGGIQARNTRGRRIKTRPIKAVTADLNTNRALWLLATKMAELV